MKNIDYSTKSSMYVCKYYGSKLLVAGQRI